jgi:nitrogen fixation/metabolism regulation signal transduction histidine kinase
MPRSVASEEHRRSSVLSAKSMKNGFKTLAQKYKEHDRSVQHAWEAYYGAGIYTKPAATRNNSSASEDSVRSESSPSTFQKAVKAVKQHAKEHHASVNAAYASYYGDSRILQQRSEEIKAFNKAY